MTGDPWPGIPAADCEAHMADPAVRQRPCPDAALATTLAAVRRHGFAPVALALTRLASGREFAAIDARRKA